MYERQHRATDLQAKALTHTVARTALLAVALLTLLTLAPPTRAAGPHNDMAPYEAAISTLVRHLAAHNAFRGVTLTLAQSATPESNFIVDHLHQFDDWTGATVIVRPFAETTLRQAEIADASARSSTISLFTLNASDIPLFAARGWIQPLGSLGPLYHQGDLLAVGRTLFSYHDALYGAPTALTTTLLYYRTDLLRRAAIAHPPTTFDTLYDDAARLTHAPRSYGIALRSGSGVDDNVYLWSAWLHAYGGDYFKGGRLIPALTSHNAVQATTAYAHLLRTAAPPYNSDWTASTVQNAFAAGLVAMTLESSALYPTLNGPLGRVVKGRIGVAAVPSGRDGRWPASTGRGLAIGRTVRDARSMVAARAFVAFSTSSAMEAAGLAELSLLNVARTSLLQSSLFTHRVATSYAAAVRLSYRSARASYRPRLPQWGAMDTIIAAALASVVSGRRSATGALSVAQAGVTQLLKAQRVYGSLLRRYQ